MSIVHHNPKHQSIETLLVDEEAVRFPKYSSFLLAGKTGSGKTSFILDFLKNHREIGHNNSYSTVYICFREEQNGIYEEIVSYLPPSTPVHLFHGSIPLDLYDRLSSGEGQHNLVILDDLALESMSSKTVSQLFFSGRHKKATVFLTTQNLFFTGTKYGRNISLNASFIVLFYTRDKRQIKTLSQQILGSDQDGFLQSAYEDAVINYGYLLIDCSSSQKVEEVRFRSNVFSESIVIYIPKNHIVQQYRKWKR
jgi:Cdc6-like AAA superfamily ATPase